MTVPIAASLVQQLGSFTPGDLSRAAIDKAQLCLVDFLSCAFAGRGYPYAAQAIAAFRCWPVSQGVPVIATDLRLSPTDAVYINSLMAASASRTDIHPASTAHPAAVVFPVAFACAALQPCSGADFIAAIVAGYEAMGRLGRIMVGAEFRRRFRSTSVIGTVGAAITAARLLCLDQPQSVHALSIAANAAAGLQEWAHSGELDLFQQPANASRAVIGAALLAREGATSSWTILEGPGGLLNAFGGIERAAELLQRRERWEIEEIEYKPVAACVFVQAAAAACEAFVKQHEAALPEVERAELRTFAAALDYPGCDNAGPIDDMQPARMSIQYSVASILGQGGLSDRNFVRMQDPRTRELLPRVSLHEDRQFTQAFPRRQGAQVDVYLKSGRMLSARVDDLPPFTEQNVVQRFRAVAAAHFDSPRIAAIERTCLDCAALERIDAALASIH